MKSAQRIVSISFQFPSYQLEQGISRRIMKISSMRCRRKNPKEAGEAMENHISRAKEFLLHFLKQTGAYSNSTEVDNIKFTTEPFCRNFRSHH